MRSKVWIINKSFCPSLDFPNNLSKQLTRRSATFHSNPSCNLKNSLKAGSWQSSSSTFRGGGSFPGSMTLRRLSPGELGEEDRHIWARRPSTWRSPFRILSGSYEERLSNARESSASMLSMENFQDSRGNRYWLNIGTNQGNHKMRRVMLIQVK